MVMCRGAAKKPALGSGSLSHRHCSNTLTRKIYSRCWPKYWLTAFPNSLKIYLISQISFSVDERHTRGELQAKQVIEIILRGFKKSFYFNPGHPGPVSGDSVDQHFRSNENLENWRFVVAMNSISIDRSVATTQPKYVSIEWIPPSNGFWD